MRTCPVLAVASGLALFALMGAAPVWAHHSFGATFDANKPVSITGVLTKVQWTNPHSRTWTSKTRTGQWWPGCSKATRQSCSTARAGRGRNVKIGDTLDGCRMARARRFSFRVGTKVTLPSGKHLFFGPLSGTR